MINSKDSNLFLGWTLDIRKMMGDKKQVYSINGTSATYKQQNDLTNEISLIANMGYEKKFSDKSKILFSLEIAPYSSTPPKPIKIVAAVNFAESFKNLRRFTRLIWFFIII